MLNKIKKLRGFTLIELIIVVAIIAILAAIAVPAFGNVSQKAKVSTDISNARTIYSVVMAEVAEAGTITPTSNPTAITNLSGLDGNPTPKAIEGTFVYTIDENGKVTVFVKPTEAQAPNIEIYPNGAAPYNK